MGSVLAVGVNIVTTQPTCRVILPASSASDCGPPACLLRCLGCAACILADALLRQTMLADRHTLTVSIVCQCMQVCLSLLGTWHGTDASQKWDPQTSSLFQILLSIQGMILISDPYFNEPNVERMRGQAEGTKASNSYNAEIHLNNIRCVLKCFLYLACRRV